MNYRKIFFGFVFSILVLAGGVKEGYAEHIDLPAGDSAPNVNPIDIQSLPLGKIDLPENGPFGPESQFFGSQSFDNPAEVIMGGNGKKQIKLTLTSKYNPIGFWFKVNVPPVKGIHYSLKKIISYGSVPKNVISISDMLVTTEDNGRTHNILGTFENFNMSSNLTSPIIGKDYIASLDVQTNGETNWAFRSQVWADIKKVNDIGNTTIFIKEFSLKKIQGGDITANYIDQNGKKIKPDEVFSGYQGDQYNLKTDIPGFKLKDSTQAEGYFTSDKKSVTLIYEKNQSFKGKIDLSYDNGVTWGDGINWDDYISSNDKFFQLKYSFSDNTTDEGTPVKISLQFADGRKSSKSDVRSSSNRQSGVFNIAKDVLKKYGSSTELKLTYTNEISGESKTVIIHLSMDNGEVKITNISPIDFGEQKIPNDVNFFNTEQPLNIQVTDTRGAGSKWKILAEESSKMTNSSNGWQPNDGTLYWKNNGKSQPIMLNESFIVGEGTTQNIPEQSLKFSEDDGVKIKMDNTFLPGKYEGSIKWTLVDAP